LHSFPTRRSSDLLVYVSSWLKCYYPDVFAGALLNSMPMGFYQPAQIVIDARKHGVEVRPVDVNLSDWDNKLEERSGNYCALRLGFRQVKGLREQDMLALISQRSKMFSSVDDLRNVGVADAVLERLADADAFRSLGLDRRQALWEVSNRDHPSAIFSGDAKLPEEKVTLPKMSLPEHVVHDYVTTSLSLKAHPVSFVREQLTSLRVLTTAGLSDVQNGDRVKVAGLILVRQ